MISFFFKKKKNHHKIIYSNWNVPMLDMYNGIGINNDINNGIKDPTRGYQNCKTGQILM